MGRGGDDGDRCGVEVEVLRAVIEGGWPYGGVQGCI